MQMWDIGGTLLKRDLKAICATVYIQYGKTQKPALTRFYMCVLIALDINLFAVLLIFKR